MSLLAESRSKDLPDNRALATVYKTLYTIRGSFLAFVFAVGVVWFLAGFILNDGVMAGLFALWGASAMLYAVLGLALVKAVRYV